MLASCTYLSARQFSRSIRLCQQLAGGEAPLTLSGRHHYPIVRVASAGGGDGARSVVVEFDNSRYIFNCGESTDRSFKDVRWNTTNMRSIFLTHLSWQNMGGLAGLGLFLQEKGVDYIAIYGPRGADKWLEAASHFVKMHSTTVDVLTCDQSKPYTNGSCNIECIPVKDENKNTINRKTTSGLWNTDKKMIDFYNYERKKLPSQSFLKRKPEGPTELNISYNYVCTFTAERRISLSKCVERGVQPGPLIYQLLNGEDITLDSGAVVKASEVLECSATNYLILVVDCPTEGYLNSLVNNKSFERFFSKNYSIENAQSSPLIVHFTPSTVMKNKRYINWMKRFPNGTSHLIVNDTNNPNTIKTALCMHEYLQKIYPKIFPPLRGVRMPSSETLPSMDDEGSDVLQNAEESSFLWRQQWKSFPKNLKLVEGRPWTCIDLSNSNILRMDEPKDKSKLVSAELSTVSEFTQASNIFYDKAGLLTGKAVRGGPIITFLGTCSKSSSTIRNSTGILVKISEEKHMILDCGEGTLRQLAMLYDASQLQKVLASLRAVYVSHLHADHHLGLISIILAHKKATLVDKTKRPLLLLAPEEITGWLTLYHNTYEPILENVVLIPLRGLELGSQGPMSSTHDAQLREVLDMALVSTCRAKHCVGAFCVSFIHKSGWKITYSGDTLFCPALVDIGKDSDLLIHEATFSSALQKMAARKKHSTTRDAVNIGKLMNAKHIVLTHFSQRYRFLPDLVDIKSMGQSNVGIAFDFMQIGFEDLELIPHLNDVYAAVFPDSLLVNEKVERRFKIGSK